MTQFTVSSRTVRVIFESKNGDFRSRYVVISQNPGDTEPMLMAKASDAYHRRYGFGHRVVSIHLN
jgi:hypothetical protein